jgi:hypothetical protein
MGKYHVVCHECREERILEEAGAARELQSTHAEATGHRVSCEQIAANAPEA